jgi:hypothetical protein
LFISIGLRRPLRVTVKCIAYALAATLLASSAQAEESLDEFLLRYYVPPPEAPLSPACVKHEVCPNEKIYELGEYPWELTAHDEQVLSRVGRWETLPPLKYDHPYLGRLLVIVGGNQIETGFACHQVRMPPILACTLPKYPGACLIIHALEDSIIETGTTLNIVLRHEIGHCNGWPEDHGYSEPFVIRGDDGGVIREYALRWIEIAGKDTEVEILGECVSACTLVVSYIPKNRLCFGPYASLKFHMAHQPDGTPSRSVTQWMIDLYPDDIRNWITANGGIDKMPSGSTEIIGAITGITMPRFWVMPARQLWDMGYRRCNG